MSLRRLKRGTIIISYYFSDNMDDILSLGETLQARMYLWSRQQLGMINDAIIIIFIRFIKIFISFIIEVFLS